MQMGSKMLSAGSVTVKTGDTWRAKGIGWPSSSADKLIAPSMKAAENERRSATEMSPGPCPHTLGVSMLMELISGKKSCLFLGTVHERVTVPPPKVPARNQTSPFCPTAQSAPVA